MDPTMIARTDELVKKYTPANTCPRCQDPCGDLIGGVCLECYLIAEEAVTYDQPFADPEGPGRLIQPDAAEQARIDQQASAICREFEESLRRWEQEQELEEQADFDGGCGID